MSEPRISVTQAFGLFAWCCTADSCVAQMCAMDELASLMSLDECSHMTIAAAADAGREHMRRFHYDKEAVVSAALDRWAAETPELDALQPAINAAIDRMNDAMNRYATHDNPLHTAHNLSREDC